MADKNTITYRFESLGIQLCILYIPADSTFSTQTQDKKISTAFIILKISFSMKMVIKRTQRQIGRVGGELHVPCCLSLTHTSLASQHSLERRHESSVSAHCLKINFLKVE